MKLYTVQPAAVYLDLMRSKKPFHADSDYIDVGYIRAYDWMCEHLNALTPRPSDVKYPIWAWQKIDGKFDFSSLLEETYKEKSVLLELDVPDDQVLLSDFNLWHYVLNDMYIDNSNDSQEWNSIMSVYECLPFDSQAVLRRESWEKIFSLSVIHTDWRQEGFNIQGVFWELRPEYIKDVEFI